MDVAVLATLQPDALRMILPGYLSQHIADPAAAASNRARVAELVAGWTDDDCRSVVRSLVTGGDGFHLFPANPQCRDLSRTWSRDAITDGGVFGAEHLRAAMNAGPTVVLCNHFSYYDATATDALLAWAGHADLADRLLFAAGPKVYQHLFRRVAAACLNTVQVPQSTKLSHTDRQSSRDVARQAMSSLEATREGIASGLALLLYPEGTRTRTGRMRSFLRGVHRYLSIVEGVHVVPAVILGTDRLMSVEDDERILPSAVSLRLLPPIAVPSADATRQVLADVHARISEALPDDHRPEPGTEPLA